MINNYCEACGQLVQYHSDRQREACRKALAEAERTKWHVVGRHIDSEKGTE